VAIAVSRLATTTISTSMMLAGIRLIISAMAHVTWLVCAPATVILSVSSLSSSPSACLTGQVERVHANVGSKSTLSPLCSLLSLTSPSLPYALPQEAERDTVARRATKSQW
jgi:hypothetical protein